MAEQSVKSELLGIAQHILTVEPFIVAINADMSGVRWHSRERFNPALTMTVFLNAPLPQGGTILNAEMAITDPDTEASITVDRGMNDDVFDGDYYVEDILEQFRRYPVSEIAVPTRQQSLLILGATALKS